MKIRPLKVVAVCLLDELIRLGGHSAEAPSEASMTAPETITSVTASENAKKDGETMIMKIGETTVSVIWEENTSVQELIELAKEGLSISMSKYGGFEQVGAIGSSISREDHRITTAPGDIVLYSGNQLVVFYGSNTWEYTRLGKIELSEKDLKDLLGNSDVTITIETEKND
jgi:hypothetical protein